MFESPIICQLSIVFDTVGYDFAINEVGIPQEVSGRLYSSNAYTQGVLIIE